ncbi:bifunctional phosphoglucose/phosphomannose isomerase [Patescibacteria group bacterium]|nr:bifunctional phosphoglucose/phosphomannose isomerase [Patescibacteria group bacterium]
MTIIDDLKKIKQIDKSNMINDLIKMPATWLDAYNLSKKIKISYKKKNFKNIFICGMGGSGIGGELINNLLKSKIKQTIIINRSFNIPKSVGPNDLIFINSYSGNTAETIACAKQAFKQKTNIFIITHNGYLKELASEKKIDIFKIKPELLPRTALPYLFMPILSVLKKLKIINNLDLNITKELTKLTIFNKSLSIKIPTEKNMAKHLAYCIFDHLPVIISSEEVSALARRMKTQIAENSKMFCFFENAPEIFHNSITSNQPRRMKDEIIFLIWANSIKKESLKKFKKIITKQEIRYEIIPDFSDNLLGNLLCSILLIDWTSFYLSILNQIDPSPVKIIEEFKK